MMKQALEDGRALKKFAEIIEAQEGDPDVCEGSDKLGRASKRDRLTAKESGFVSKIHPRKVALAALEVGAGRRTKEDNIDPVTGVVLAVRVGESVEKGQELATLHHNNKGDDVARELLEDAFELTGEPGEIDDLVIERY